MVNNFIKRTNMKKIAIITASVALLMSSCMIDKKFPVLYTNNTIEKTGVASKVCPLNFCFGDADLGIGTAAKNGGITKIATVDYTIEGSFFSVKYSTVVTGE
jgi:hypothetical protein